MRLQHVAMVIIFALLLACGNNDNEQKGDLAMKDIKKEATDVYRTTKKYTQQEKDSLMHKMNSQIDSLKQNIAELKADAKNASAATREKMEQQIQAMEAETDSLGKKINNFGSATGKAWNDFAAGTEKSLQDLKNAVDKAKERFK